MLIFVDFCGKIAFGKYFPYKTVDISVLVDVNNGEVKKYWINDKKNIFFYLQDLAFVTVPDPDKMTFEDLKSYLRSKVTKIKKKTGHLYIDIYYFIKLIFYKKILNKINKEIYLEWYQLCNILFFISIIFLKIIWIFNIN